MTQKNSISGYVPGDFSFVKEYQDIFEYDYMVINKMGEIAWNKLKKYDDKSTDYLINIIQSQMYPGHSGLTYKLSMKYLTHIAKYGWYDFVSWYDKLT